MYDIRRGCGEGGEVGWERDIVPLLKKNEGWKQSIYNIFFLSRLRG